MSEGASHPLPQDCLLPRQDSPIGNIEFSTIVNMCNVSFRKVHGGHLVQPSQFTDGELRSTEVA